VRASVLVFPPTEYAIVPVSEPDVLDTVIHDASAAAVHPHVPALLVTVADACPPDALVDCDVGDSV